MKVIPETCRTNSQWVGIDNGYYRKLRFLNKIIIIKTEDFLPQIYVTLADFDCPV